MRKSSRSQVPTLKKIESDAQIAEYRKERESHNQSSQQWKRRRKVLLADEDGEVHQQFSDYDDMGLFDSYYPSAHQDPIRADAVQMEVNPWIKAFNSQRQHRLTQVYVLSWSKTCSFCSCRLLSSEKDGWCCNSGKWIMPRLRPIPDAILEVGRLLPKGVGGVSRKLNNLFSISNIAVSEGSFLTSKDFRNMDHNIVVQGRTYHWIAGHEERTNSIRWFLYDEAGRSNEAQKHGVPQSLVQAWAAFLEQQNRYVKQFEAAHQNAGGAEFDVVLDDESALGEVAAISNSVNLQTINPRQIVVKKRNSDYQFVNILSSHYEPLQYPILFPYGEDGWSLQRKKYGHPALTQIDYYRMLLLREERFVEYHRVAQEYIVDMFSRTEDERLHFIKKGREYQKSNFHSFEDNADISTEQWESMLPESFPGSPAWAKKNVHESMTLCRTFGNPSLFLTMTTNPKWPEILEQLLPGQTAHDVPHIVVRVFHEKMRKMLSYLETASGPFKYLITVVEFQKRGLPHCHVLIKFQNELTVANVDDLVSAELPTEAADPALRRLVLEFNMHKESHLDSPTSYCRRGNKCRMGFPYSTPQMATTYDERGRIRFRRRKEEDRWVCPYIPALTRLLQCHTYIDVPHNVAVVLYLYKYFFKGNDQTRFSIAEAINGDSEDVADGMTLHIRGRYLSASEGVWRIFRYNISTKRPSVKCLHCHLPGRNLGSMSSGRKASTSSDLLYYFARPLDPLFDDLTFAQYFEQYSRKPKLSRKDESYPNWMELQIQGNPQRPKHVVRKRRARMIVTIGLISLKYAEVYYLRILLLHHAARSYEDLRTVDGVCYETFEEACKKHGHLEDEHETEHALEELIELRYSPQHLRFVFAQHLVDLAAPALTIWELFKDKMVEDFAELPTPESRESAALRDIERLLRFRGSSLEKCGLPRPKAMSSALDRELQILAREKTREWELYEANSKKLNEEQRQLLEVLISRRNAKDGSCIFVEGRAGRGKSFLLQTFVSWLRGQGVVVLVVGTTALSVLSYDRGRTAHSTFNIPIEKNKTELTCNVFEGSDQWLLLEAAEVIIWEELPMANRIILESVEVLLRPFRSQERSKGFGSCLFIGTGDFRQVAPVIKGGTKDEIIDASIRQSRLWGWFETKTLTTPVRFDDDLPFGQWLDLVGDGEADYILQDGVPYISLDRFDVVTTADDAIEEIFPSAILGDPIRCLSRALLSPINKDVESHNQAVLEKLPGEKVTLYGFNKLKDDDQFLRDMTDRAAINEWLGDIRDTSAPPQLLELKIGCVCAIMRNLSTELGLVRNVRVVVKAINKNTITVRTIGNGIDSDQKDHTLPRITFEFVPSWNFYTMIRRQFPLRLAYSTTFNSCQGLTLDKVVLDMANQPFAHGQLYTALSRVRHGHDLLLLNPMRGSKLTEIEEDEAVDANSIVGANYVYSEIIGDVPDALA